MKKKIILKKKIVEYKNKIEELQKLILNSSSNENFNGENSPTIEIKKNIKISSDIYKMCLIIGNQNYPSIELDNAVNDAELFQKSVKDLGFNEVVIRLDANFNEMDDTITKFCEKRKKISEEMKKKTLVLFYFSGHGIEYNGENYLIPVDFKFSFKAKLRSSTVNLNDARNMFRECDDNGIDIIILGF